MKGYRKKSSNDVSMDEIRNLYGSDHINTDENKTKQLEGGS